MLSSANETTIDYRGTAINRGWGGSAAGGLKLNILRAF